MPLFAGFNPEQLSLATRCERKTENWQVQQCWYFTRHGPFWRPKTDWEEHLV